MKLLFLFSFHCDIPTAIESILTLPSKFFNVIRLFPPSESETLFFNKVKIF